MISSNRTTYHTSHSNRATTGASYCWGTWVAHANIKNVPTIISPMSRWGVDNYFLCVVVAVPFQIISYSSLEGRFVREMWWRSRILSLANRQRESHHALSRGSAVLTSKDAALPPAPSEEQHRVKAEHLGWWRSAYHHAGPIVHMAGRQGIDLSGEWRRRSAAPFSYNISRAQKWPMSYHSSGN